jgi:hypothetical protein
VLNFEVQVAPGLRQETSPDRSDPASQKDREGFVLGSRPEENRSALLEFLSEPFVTVVNVDEAVA